VVRGDVMNALFAREAKHFFAGVGQELTMN
jgi:hypothetical protein